MEKQEEQHQFHRNPSTNIDMSYRIYSIDQLISLMLSCFLWISMRRRVIIGSKVFQNFSLKNSADEMVTHRLCLM